MNARDITIETFKKNSLLKSGIILMIIFAIIYVIGGAIGLIGFFNGTLGEDPRFIIPLCMCAGIGFVLWISGIILIVWGVKGRNTYNKFIETYGEDALMSEIHNNTLYILSRKNKPVTIVTNKHVFEIGQNIYDSPIIDLAYGYRYKGSTSIHAYTITDKSCVFARGIILKSQEQTDLFMALQKANPYIILGFTSEALKEHKKRVKEFRQTQR